MVDLPEPIVPNENRRIPMTARLLRVPGRVCCIGIGGESMDMSMVASNQNGGVGLALRRAHYRSFTRSGEAGVPADEFIASP